jgi:hypothetical protein
MSRACRQNPRSGRFSRLGRVPHSARPLLAAALAAASLWLVACGGGEDAQLLPGETAREITANLDSVKQLSDEGDCLGAESAAGQVSEQIEALTGVDRRLKQALQAGAARLNEVIAECEEESEAVAPAEVAPEGEAEKASKAEQKEREKEAKREKATPEAAEKGEGPPELPPQANGKGKGLENGNGPPAEAGGGGEGEAVNPSGGVGPGAPATGEGD